jgi:hypothetical protein
MIAAATTRAIVVTCAIALFLSALAVSPVFAQGGHTTERFTEDFDFVVPVNEGCTGEAVHVYGPIDVIVQTTTDAKGRTHLTTHYSPHLTAVGLTTGKRYLAVGPTQIVSFDAGGPAVFNVANIIITVAPGSGDNFVLTEVVHVTLNANGDVTVDFDRVNVACRG